MRFEPSIVTVKQSFIVSQTVVLIMSALLFAIILSWCCTLREYVVILKFVPVVNTPGSASFTQKFIDFLIYRVTQNFEIAFRWLSCPTVDLSRKEAVTGAVIFSEGEIPFFRE